MALGGASTNSTPPTRTFRDYQILRVIGTGTFGRVFVGVLNPGTARSRYVDPASPRPVAIKMLKKSQIVHMRQIEHINQEKNILMEIDHPFIVQM